MGFFSRIIRRLPPKESKTMWGPIKETRKEWVILNRCRFVYEHRSPENLWGRFGGGWNWKVGVCVGGSTVILECLIFTIQFRPWEEPKEEDVAA